MQVKTGFRAHDVACQHGSTARIFGKRLRRTGGNLVPTVQVLEISDAVAAGAVPQPYAGVKSAPFLSSAKGLRRWLRLRYSRPFGTPSLALGRS